MLVRIKLPTKARNLLNRVLLSEEGQNKAIITEIQVECTCNEVSDDEEEIEYEATEIRYILEEK